MRVSEVYASSQGEGPNVGKTTVFVRFGGCNLRCPGWPCDTQHAIDPMYRKEWIQHTPDELLQKTLDVADMAGAKLITLTGGEPFLQRTDELQAFVESLHNLEFEVECFSNGTLSYPAWAPNLISFIMDWKLPGSGEDAMNKTRLANISKLAGGRLTQAVKFVIKDERDMQAAHGLWFSYLREAPASRLEVFYGKVWDGEIEDKDLVAYVMSNGLPWRLNRQEHNYIWPANERGR